MKKTFVLLGLLFIFCFAACDKGEIGPEGPQGAQGEQGTQGIAGADGTKIHSGTAAPDVNLGAEGDFYLRTSNSVLYGPKTSTGWGAGSSLKGAAGTSGTKMLSGTAEPATSLGATGDFYFRTTTGILYGPKTSSSWGAGTSLKGLKGDKGDKGDKGENGNANVQMFEIGRRSFTGSLALDLPISYEDAIAKNMLVYVKYGNPWRQVSFRIQNFMVDYSTFPFNDNFRVTLSVRNPTTYALHGNLVTFGGIRIIFIEASQVTKMATAGVDMKNFDQVKAALNIQ